ncbi:hypothetical protein [Fodinibius sp.]|uniref:hypothetical protein n=1 Tax=Fodinibius sp. TaxID=1872440 RepID=UPI002ACE32AC|nr:hypothetical protein [Fodinibius sp.]MDZ7658025.1 hypothetical protein [Fodinibius sp.]
MIREIQKLVSSLPGFLATLLTIILIIWAILWFFLPFFIWGIYEKSKGIEQRFDQLLNRQSEKEPEADI